MTRESDTGDGLSPGLPTRGHHVFVPSLDSGPFVVIEGNEAHHLARVLKLKEDDPLSLADNTGAVAQCVVRSVQGSRVSVEVTRTFLIPADQPRITVVQALPKGRKMEQIVQDLTEIGVDRLIPAHTARTIKYINADKLDRVATRWHGVAVAAAQQSRRPRLMEIAPVTSWPSEPGVGGVILYEQADQPLSDALANLPAAADIVIAVGPEGGWEAQEVQRSGLRPAALGQTILRTETAGLVGASLVLHHLGRLG